MKSNLDKLNKTCSSVQNNYDTAIVSLKKVGMEQVIAYQQVWNAMSEEVQNSCKTTYDKVTQSWTDFQNDVSDKIEQLIADESYDETKVSKVFGLYAFDTDGNAKDYSETESKGNSFVNAQNSATSRKKNLNTLEAELQEAQEEYDDLLESQ